MSKTFSRVVAATTAATALVAGAVLPANALAAPAAAAPTANPDAGLFGAADPTYDGMFRQGLAITGLSAVTKPVPAAAVRWTRKQQCADGSFQAYRADTSAACAKPDPVNFTGPDTNSTALGAMALAATGNRSRAAHAGEWLLSVQNKDGGFPYIPGGASDSNSTGLTLAALRGQSVNAATRKAIRRATRYLDGMQLRCGAAADQRGRIAFQMDPSTPAAANDLATAQAALGLTTTLPSLPESQAVSASASFNAGARIRCTGNRQRGDSNIAASTLRALRNRIAASGGLLPSSLGSGPDVSATAQAAVALAASDAYRVDVRKIKRKLAKQAPDFVKSGSAADPAAAGLLLLVLGATGSSDENDFGGVDLVRTLRGTLR